MKQEPAEITLKASFSKPKGQSVAEDRRRLGRRPIDRYWIERMKALCAGEPRPTNRDIAEELRAVGLRLGRNDYPSERTIPALKKRFYDPLPEGKKREYTLARWPESFITDDLPWEASATILELLQLYLAEGEQHRPTVRAARWFWHVTQAMPRAPATERSAIAWVLTANELLGGELPSDTARRLELLARSPGLPVLRVGQTDVTRAEIISELMAKTWVRMLEGSIARATERRLRGGLAAGDEIMEHERRLLEAVMEFAPVPGLWAVVGRALREWAREMAEERRGPQPKAQEGEETNG